MSAAIINRNDLKLIWITSYTPKNIQEGGTSMIFWKSWILSHPKSVPTYSSFVPWKGILLLYQTTIQIYSEIGTSSFLFQIVFWLWTGSFASILLREKY